MKNHYTHTHTHKPWTKLILFFFSLLTFTFFTSCQKDLLEEPDTNADINAKSGGISMIDGRLYFPSKESLGETFVYYSDAPESELYEFMQGFYSSGFFSLRPPAYEEIESAIISQYEARVTAFFEKYGSIMDAETIYERIDDTQYIIGSDAFATLLNENGEIHVDDMIYKYTDVGLFFVNEDNYEGLTTFLSERNISDNLIIRTTESALDLFSIEAVGRGYSEFEGGEILFFVSPCEPIDPNITDPLSLPPDPGSPINEPCSWGGGGSSNPNPTPQNPLSGYQDFANSLEVCNDNSGWLSWLFGVNRICNDRYADRRRVRTQVLIHEYVLPGFDYYKVQSKVRHQRLASGIWWRKKADVVVMDVSAIQLQYDYSALITSGFQNLNPTSVNYSVKPALSTFNVDSNIWVNPNGTQGYSFISSSSWSPNIPTIFHDDLIIEAFKMGYDMDNGELNESFWKSVWNSAENQLKSLTNDPNWENPLNVTLLANYPDLKNMLVQRSYFSYCTDCRRRKKTFDFDGSFNIGVSYNAVSGKFDYISSSGILVTPKLAGTAMVGAVRVNGTWHGSRIHYKMGDD